MTLIPTSVRRTSSVPVQQLGRAEAGSGDSPERSSLRLSLQGKPLLAGRRIAGQGFTPSERAD